MNKAEDLQKLLQGIGATTEMTRLYYDNYLRVGFTTRQAFELASNITIAHIQIAALTPKKGDAE